MPQLFKERADLYSVLDLPNFSSIEEVLKAHKRLCFEHHPDKGGNLEKMQLINHAKDIIIKHKIQYDAALARVLFPEPAPVVIHRDFWGEGTDSTDSNMNGYTGFTWEFASG